MTPAIESAIEQREAMLRRAEGTVKAAEDAAKSATDTATKDSHLTVASRVGERVKELRAQIAQLRGGPNKEPKPVSPS